MKFALGKTAEAEPMLAHLLEKADFAVPSQLANAIALADLFVEQGRRPDALVLLDKVQPALDAEPQRFAQQAKEARAVREKLAKR